MLCVTAHRICRTWFRRTFCENLLERTWAQIWIFLSRFQVCLICATKIVLCISSIWVFLFVLTIWTTKTSTAGSNLLKIKRIWSRPEDQGFCVKKLERSMFPHIITWTCELIILSEVFAKLWLSIQQPLPSSCWVSNWEKCVVGHYVKDASKAFHWCLR